MATSGGWSTSWASSTWAGSPKTYNWSGNWDKNGNTITLYNMKLWMETPGHTSWGTGSDTVTVTGGNAQSVSMTFNNSSVSTQASLWDASFGVGSQDTRVTIYCYIDGEVTGNISFDFDPTGSAPTGLTISSISATPETVSATISIDSWGNPDGSSSSYREINVSSTGEPSTRRFQKAYGAAMSSTITATNSSEQLGGMNIVPNTMYYIWAYAYNSVMYSETSYTGASVVTPAYPLSSKEITKTSATSARIDYTLPASGGSYNLVIEYKVGDDGEWKTVLRTISPSSDYSGSFTVSNIPSDTQKIYLRVTSVRTVGISIVKLAFSDSGYVVFNDLPEQSVLYASVSSEARKVKRLYASVSSKAKVVKKLYASVNGKTKRIL